MERDEATEHEVNPITSVDENPFEDVKDDAASDKSYDFAETIKILDNDKEVVMRALLDTGMRMNAIARDKAVKSEFLIEPYKGPALKGRRWTRLLSDRRRQSAVLLQRL